MAFVLLLSGCTEEKAQALLNAALQFRNEANKAIDAYAALAEAGTYTVELNDEDLKKAITAQYNALGANYGAADNSKALQMLIPLFNEDINGDYAKKSLDAEFDALRNGYNQFASSLANLPKASYLVDAGRIDCVAEIGVRLTYNLSKMSVSLYSAPPALKTHMEGAKARLNHALKAEKKADNTPAEIAQIAEEKIVAIRDLKQLIQREQTLRAAAYSQTAIAVKAGQQAVGAAEDYDNLSVADILSLVEKGLNLVEESNVFNVKKAQDYLGQYKSDLENDSRWKDILDKDIYAPESACNKAATTRSSS